MSAYRPAEARKIVVTEPYYGARYRPPPYAAYPYWRTVYAAAFKAPPFSSGGGFPLIPDLGGASNYTLPFPPFLLFRDVRRR